MRHPVGFVTCLLTGARHAYQTGAISPDTYAAIGVGAIRTRMHEERRRWIAELMRDELRGGGWSLMPG